MSEPRDLVYVTHILEAISTIESYVSGLDEDGFSRSKLIQDGVIRQLEIMGEATKNLSRSLREDNPHVPWKDIAGLRDKLIHQYFGVDLPVVWDVVVRDIPGIKSSMEEILESLGSYYA